MKRVFVLFFSIVISSFAVAAQPNPESVDKLLSMMHTEKLLDSVLQNLDGVMKKSIDQSLQGQNVTEQGLKIADTYMQKVMIIMKDELSWAKMKPLYIQIYAESFSQEEIDGLIAFYASPAGQAYIDKLPLVTQKTMVLTQARMVPMMQRMQEAMQQAVAEAKAAK
ncbi:MAG: hypothetical protein JWN23_3378 [Rhodocyclales bacterium]|nr:hypothetical protein [Rhodocyclales bacterium]